MAMPALKMPKEEAEDVVLKIMSRKKTADREQIEASFARSVDAAGLTTRRVITAALKHLTERGNLKVDKRNGKYKWCTSRKNL